MSGPVRGLRRVAVAYAVLGALLPAAVGAQSGGAVPLTKADLVRAIASDAYTPDELVEIIRRSCLSFEPTARDREDLRSLGATDAVLRAVDSCPSAPAPAAALTVSLDRARVTIAAGTSGTVSLTAMRGDRPAVGVPLQLAGPAGDGLSATTDSRGRASIRVPAGVRVRSFRMSVRAPGVGPNSAPTLIVDVVPGPPASGRLTPSRVVVDPADETPVDVTASLADEFGNAVSGQAVELIGSGGAVVATGVTDARGQAALGVGTGELEPGELELRVGDRAITHMTVDRLAPPEPEVPPSRSPAREPPADPVDSGEGAVGADARQPEVPDDAESLRAHVEAGREALADGRATDAAERFRAALAVDPESREALAGLAAAEEAAGETEEALALYRAAVARAPTDLELRLELARFLERSGRYAEAERAYVALLDRNATNVRASRELARLRLRPVGVELGGLGGALVESDPRAALLGAELSIRPVRAARLWGRYDRSLGLEQVPMLRGPDEIEGLFGGAEVFWGPDARLATSVEGGRRTAPPRAASSDADGLGEDLVQNFVRVEQRVLVPAGFSFARIAVGGYLGRWFDRDDMVAYGRAEVPVGRDFSVGPALFVGETIGSNTLETGRSVEREIRGYLPITYRSRSGWLVEPGAAVGRVDGETPATTGTLYEGRLLVEIPVAGAHRARLMVRHQSSPGSRTYTLAAAGLRLRIR